MAETLEKRPSLVSRAVANVVEEDLCMDLTEAGAMVSQSAKQSDIEGGQLKRKNWSDEETDLLLEVVASEKAKPRSGLNDELFWEGVAKAVPRWTGRECRMRMESLKKSYNAMKNYCDMWEKEFADLKDADFAEMKLATRMTERWYNQIRDHCPPRPAKRFRAQGTVGLMVGGLDNSVVISTDVASPSGPPRVSQITEVFGTERAVSNEIEWVDESRLDRARVNELEWEPWYSLKLDTLEQELSRGKTEVDWDSSLLKSSILGCDNISGKEFNQPRCAIGTSTMPQSHQIEIGDQVEIMPQSHQIEVVDGVKISDNSIGQPEDHPHMRIYSSIQDHMNDISNSNTSGSDNEFIHALKEMMEAMASIQIIDSEEAFLEGKCGDQSTIVLGTFNVTNDKLEFYFESGERMAKLVGVGLSYGKAIVKRGLIYEVHEVEQNAWEKVWLEAKEFSTKLYTVMQVSLPIRGLRSEQIGGNVASSSSSSKQSFQDIAYVASNGALEVPCIWELAKFFIVKQVIDVLQNDDNNGVSNGSFGINIKKDHPKDGNDTIMTWSQTLKGMFSKGAREANDKVGAIKSLGKDEGGGGGNSGDGNGNDDNKFYGGNLKVDDTEECFTMVNVFLLGGGNFFEMNMEQLSSRLPLSIERLDNVEITPELTFGFCRSQGSKKIQVRAKALFALDGDCDDIDGSGHFGWFHDKLHVSFGPMDRNIGRNVYLKIDFKETESISGKTTTTTSISRDTTKGKGIEYQVGLDVGSTQGARLRLGAKPHHEEMSMDHQSNEQSLESQINQTSGGFNIQALPKINHALLEYKYTAPYFEINAERIHDPKYRHDLSLHPKCNLQMTEFVGTWVPTSSNEVVEYIFKADRRLYEISRRVMEQSTSTPRGFTKRFKKSNLECPHVCVSSFLERPIMQVYEKQLHVNHAMTHLINGQIYTLFESSMRDNPYQDLDAPLVTFPILVDYQ